MLTAKSNGWLAAKQLGYADCSRLVPIGATARLEFCQANIVSLSVEHTSCGPQPKISDNLTVNINGFETAKLINCYHKGNLVNLNEYPYTFQDGAWVKLPQTIPLNSEGFISKFAFEADNSLETFMKMDPYFVDVSDQISVLADIVGIINEHTPDAIIKKPHASSALIPSYEKKPLSSTKYRHMVIVFRRHFNRNNHKPHPIQTMRRTIVNATRLQLSRSSPMGFKSTERKLLRPLQL
jgi:hypothetical protein